MFSNVVIYVQVFFVSCLCWIPEQVLNPIHFVGEYPVKSPPVTISLLTKNARYSASLHICQNPGDFDPFLINTHPK